MLQIVDFLQLLLVLPGAALLYAALYWLGRYSRWLRQSRREEGTEWADVRIIQRELDGYAKALIRSGHWQRTMN